MRQRKVRLLSGQGAQEGHDAGVLGCGELLAQLQAAHRVDRFGQGCGGAVVEVRIGQFDVTQGRHLEVEAVAILAGDGNPAFGRAGCLVILDDAHLLEGIAAHCRAVVTGHAAAVLEQLVAGEFLGVEGLLVALQPLVEARIRRDEGFLEGGDGLGDPVDVHFGRAESLLEGAHVAGDGFQGGDRVLVGEGHFAGVGDGASGLLLQILRAAVPELGEVEARVEDGRGVDRAFLPAVADGALQVVRAAHGQVVAGVTRDEAGLRQAGIEEQHLAELDRGRVAGFGGRYRLDGFGGGRSLAGG